MFDPEYYLSQYEVKDLSTGTTRTVSGRYRDMAQCGPREELVSSSAECQTSERLGFYCVSIPGESPWVLDSYRSQSAGAPGAAGGGTRQQQQQNPLKRSHENGAAADVDMDDVDAEKRSKTDSAPNGQNVRHTNGRYKSTIRYAIIKYSVSRLPRNVKTFCTRVSKKYLLDYLKHLLFVELLSSFTSVCLFFLSRSTGSSLNLPIPSQSGRAAVVKMYEVEDGAVKLNDVLDMVGIVSLDPTVGASGDLSAANLPPPSLVPRIHVLHFKKLQHNNPLVKELPSFNNEVDICTSQSTSSKDDVL